MSAARTANSTLASDASPGSSMAVALSTTSNLPPQPSPLPASSASPTTSTSPPTSVKEQPSSTVMTTTTVSRSPVSPPIPTIASESDNLTAASPPSRPLTTNRSPSPVAITDAVLSPPPPPTQQLVSPSPIMSQASNPFPPLGSTASPTDPVPISPSSPQKDLPTSAGQFAVPSEVEPSSQELKPDGQFSTSLFSSAPPNSPTTQQSTSSTVTPATALLENNGSSDLSSSMPFGAVLAIVLSVFFLLILSVCLIRRWLLPKSEAFQRRKMNMQSFLPFRVSENPPLDTVNMDAAGTVPAVPLPNSEMFNGFGPLHAPLLHRSESFPACMSAATTLTRKNDSQVFDVGCVSGERLASGKEQVEGVLVDASFLEFISEMAPVSRHFSVASMRPRPTSAISDCPSKYGEYTLNATPNIITPISDPSDPAATLGRNNRGADPAFLVSK